MINRGFRAAAALALLTSIAVGCGDDDDDDTATTEGAAAATTEAASAGTTAGASADTKAAVVTTAPSTTEAEDAETASGTDFVIKDFAFPESFVAKAGEAFTVTNSDDGSQHTVTSDDDVFSIAVDGGASEQLTIDEAGTYAIHCNIHPSMKGTITVE